MLRLSSCTASAFLSIFGAKDIAENFSGRVVVPYLEDAGSGIPDVKAIVSAGQRAEVEHFIIERALVPESEIDFRKSCEFVSSLK